MARFKHTQLWLHHHYKEIRTWLMVGVGVMILIFSMIMIANQNRLISQVKGLAEQNAQLSKDNKQLNTQSKNIATQNNQIAKQSRNYTKCVATIFAQYTHDFIPITITNLDTCTTVNDHTIGQSSANMPTTSGLSAGQTQSPPSSQSSQSQGSSSAGQQPNTGSTDNNPQPPPSKPLNCTIDLLGLHIGCP